MSENAMTNMPARFQAKPLREAKTIGEALRHPEVVERFRQAVPRHLSPERLLRVCALCIQKTPKLAECDMMGLLGAMLALASLGLEPNTPLGHAYLIPFEKRGKVNGQWQTTGVDIQVIIGYRGYLDLARRGGSMVSLHADVVYEGDEFSFEYGSKMHLRHVPIGARDGRKPIWAYAHAKLTDGEAFEVLPYAQVLKIRDGSQGYQSALRGRERNPRGFETSPWVAYEPEMASKTMIRRISKMLPMSIEMANAAALDSMSEIGKANLRELATAPTEQLADMGMIAHDTTISPIDFGSGDEREPVEINEHAQDGLADVRHAQARPQAASGAARSSPPPAPAEPSQRPAQAASPPTFEAYLSDEFGEPAMDGDVEAYYTDPVLFARSFVNRLAAASTPAAMFEHNADAVEEARRASPQARQILDDGLAALGPTDNAAASVQDQGASLAVAMPMNAGRPDLKAFLAAIEASLARHVQRPEDVTGWEAANRETVNKLPAATKKAVQALHDARLAAVRPAPTDPTAANLAGLLADVRDCRSVNAVHEVGANAAFRARLNRLPPEGQQQVRDAMADQRETLKGAEAGS